MANLRLNDWLDAPVAEVGPRLLGAVLTHRAEAGTVAVQLTEVEAYDGESDPASHAWRGRTARNAVMFGPAGFLYVYFSYGVHWCANVVCGADGRVAAVLLRSGRVVQGVELARERRGPVANRALARGPACFARALGIGPEHGGADLRGAGPLVLEPGRQPAWSSGPRVGVSRAEERPWRFWATGDETVSAYRRSAHAAR